MLLNMVHVLSGALTLTCLICGLIAAWRYSVVRRYASRETTGALLGMTVILFSVMIRAGWFFLYHYGYSFDAEPGVPPIYTLIFLVSQASLLLGLYWIVRVWTVEVVGEAGWSSLAILSFGFSLLMRGLM